ncbi:MAG TPA: hypothetical protein VF509_03060 [Sphingobium sp.]
MTHRPDLTTKAGRKAYKHELRMVAVRPRRLGLLLLGAGMVLAVLPLSGVHSLFGFSPGFLAVAAAGLATPFLIAAVLLRGKYHRRRLSEERPNLPG